MNSFLVVGASSLQRKEEALGFAKTYRVSRFDIYILEPSKNESIGINEIREVRTSLFLKPFNSPFKLVVLLNFEKATTQAQNAFLKTLEEPPEDTIIVLAARNSDLLLPTIVSRCQVIRLGTDNKLANAEFRISSARLADRILVGGGVGDKLKLAQDHGKTREDALAFIEEVIITARQELINNILKNDNRLISGYLNLLISFQRTHTELSTTNVSPRFALENLFLNLP